MEKTYRQALAEVVAILKRTDKEIVDKIPSSLIEDFLNNLDREYIPQIDFGKENWEEDVLEETQAIIGWIYRDYLVSEAEKEQLLAEEKEVSDKDKVGIESLFTNHEKVEEKINVQNVMLTTPTEMGFFKKLYKKFTELFKGKK